MVSSNLVAVPVGLFVFTPEFPAVLILAVPGPADVVLLPALKFSPSRLSFWPYSISSVSLPPGLLLEIRQLDIAPTCDKNSQDILNSLHDYYE